MAQLAAQDYFTRLQASGLSGFPHPDLAAAFPGGLGMGGVNSSGNPMTSSQSSSANSRQSGGGESKGKSRKEKKSSNNNSTGGGNAHNNITGGSNSASLSMTSAMLPTSSPTSYKVKIETNCISYDTWRMNRANARCRTIPFSLQNVFFSALAHENKPSSIHFPGSNFHLYRKHDKRT